MRARTWDSLALPEGDVLLVVNSTEHEQGLVSDVVDALTAIVDLSRICVISAASWRVWLSERGFSDARVLLALDERGRDIEVHHFLLSSAALRWIQAGEIRTFMGTKPHDVMNELVHEALERQVSVLVGKGWMIAHTLPAQVLYLFDAAMLVRRLARPQLVEGYREKAGRLLDSLHEVWSSVKASEPGGADEPAEAWMHSLLVECGLTRRRVEELDCGGVARACAGRLDDVRRLLHQRDERLAALEALVAERNQAVELRDRAVELRDRLLADGQTERNQVVELRDRLLAGERERYARTLDARVNRGLGKIKRLLRGE